MLKNHLKIIVLKTLADRKMSGYDLIKEIHDSTGYWKPSYGSIYPLLKDLLKNNMLDVKSIGRRKVYSLTAQGKKNITEILKSREDTMQTMAKEFKVMESICDDDDKKFITTLLSHMQHHEAMFAEVTEEIGNLQRIMLRLVTNGKLQSHKKEIKKILIDTAEKLKSLERKNGNR